MNAQQARELVANTLPHPFDKTRFRRFALNLLHDIDESKARAWNAGDVKPAFNDHVGSYERLGTYTSPEKDKLDVLIVHLRAEWKLQRARTAIRNFVADHLKTGDNKDAALVAFVSPTESHWRFSYVKMEHTAVANGDGKVGLLTTLTPARRSSYIVGKGESCHTAQSRFLDLLQNTKNKPTLVQIEEAFSVEAVTKEFFEQYKGLFLQLNAELGGLAKKDRRIGSEFAAKQVKTADFAKKLMGQIVFLYFLQRKGWLGVPKGGDWGDGPHDFLRQLFASSSRTGKNFFNDILEPLFYDTLATDRGHEAWCKVFNCRIPFLNGGLFEPLGDYDWRGTEIVIPDALFSNERTTAQGDTGTGILDEFDRYNFTVNEAEPLEKEVAIDPEMLGKVFERLLDVEVRKAKGSFYTPREIVHYMCQESLVNYLDTAMNAGSESISRAAEQVALFGGAKAQQASLRAPVYREVVPRADIEAFIHSGDQASFYETARREGSSYNRKLPKTIEIHARVLDEQLEQITVCDPAIGSGAFPVGMMQEIVRARSSLTPYFNDVRERTPYQFKRHAIQSCLYGVDIDPGAVEIAKLRLWLSLVVDEDDVKRIKPLPNLDYKVVKGNSLLGVQKRLYNWDLFTRLEGLKPHYFEATDRKRKKTEKHEIDALIRELTNGMEDFDFEIYFSEVFHRKGGFDVVIGNPPYVRQESIKDFKPALEAQKYECFTGTADLLVYFYERGVKLLRGAGTIALITSNKFYRAGYGEKLRRFLARELTLNRLVDFGDAPVFEAVAYASILVGIRETPSRDAKATAYTWGKGVPFDRIAQVVRERGLQIQQRELKPEGWRLDSPKALRLLEKLRVTGKPLREFVGSRVYRGITTGFNTAFVVDRETRDRLVRQQKACAELMKPYLRGRDVDRWRAESPDDLWIIFTRRGTDIRKYPAIREHLEQFKRELSPGRPGGRKPGSYEWYEIQDNIAYWPEFEKPKIISTKISVRPTFALDSQGRYLGNTSYFFTAATAGNYVLGLLNSTVFLYYARQVFVEKQGGWFEIQPDGLESFPIPTAPTEKQRTLGRVVERILAAKGSDAAADVSSLERELNESAYALYDLTPDEIKLVEEEDG